VQRACNRTIMALLARCGHRASVEWDRSGDLRLGDRKVGGLALRRRRDATLLHGTLLTSSADVAAIAAVLHHPAREPDWRRNRPHLDFVGTLEAFDVAQFIDALRTARVAL
jgi:lipoate-protein ligase A